MPEGISLWHRFYSNIILYSFSLAQRKRTKRDIHPLQGLPLYGEDATAPPVALILVSSDHQRSGLSVYAAALYVEDSLIIYAIGKHRGVQGARSPRASRLRASPSGGRGGRYKMLIKVYCVRGTDRVLERSGN